MKKHFFCFIAFIVIALSANAQVMLQSFQIYNNNLQNNALKVPNSTTSTPFKFVVSLNRFIEPTGGYVAGNCKISVLYTESASSGDGSIKGDPSTITIASRNVTSSDYNTNQAIIDNLDGTLPANKTNGRILLIVDYMDTQNQPRTLFSSTRYGIYVLPSTVTPPTQTIDQAVIAKIQAMGFNTSAISSEGEFYVVENDILIRKSTLFQNAGIFYVGDHAQHNINILVKKVIWSNNEWNDGIQQAIAQWNNANSDIKLHYVIQSGNDIPDSDIVIDFMSSTMPTRSEFPNGNGHPGKMIYIGSLNSFSINTAAIIAHSIGHALGFKNNTTANSIMNYGMSNNYIFPMNNSDNQLISSIYPLNPNSNVIPYISGFTSLTPYESQSFQMSYLTLGSQHSWEVIATNGTNGVGIPDISWASQSRLPEISFGEGSYQIKCLIQTNKYSSQVIATKNISVQ